MGILESANMAYLGGKLKSEKVACQLVNWSAWIWALNW